MPSVFTFVLLLVIPSLSFSQTSTQPDLTPITTVFSGETYYCWDEEAAQFIASEIQHSRDCDSLKIIQERDLSQCQDEINQKDETIRIAENQRRVSFNIRRSLSEQLDKEIELKKKFKTKAKVWKFLGIGGGTVATIGGFVAGFLLAR